jgi:hypothetical protein
VRRRLSLDQARLLPHLRERVRLVEEQAAVLRREFERAAAEGVEATAPGRWIGPAGDDLDRLRGLPAVGRNVRGAIRGTDPLGETIRRSERRAGGR